MLNSLQHICWCYLLSILFIKTIRRCQWTVTGLVKIAICGLHSTVLDAVQKHSLLRSSISAPHLINFHQTRYRYARVGQNGQTFGACLFSARMSERLCPPSPATTYVFTIPQKKNFLVQSKYISLRFLRSLYLWLP